MTRRYRIEHRTEYRYSDEVSTSFGRGYLRPREIPDRQRCLAYSLTIDPAPSDLTDGVDVFGNPNSYFHVTDAHTELVVTGRSEVEVTVPATDPEVLAHPWERARPGLDDPKAIEFTLASPLVRIPAQIHQYAAVTFTPRRPIGEAIVELTHRIFTEFKYHPGSTSVSSTVAEVLAARAGVCQDFAHVAVACLRSVGLACRYVSGYLATDPPPGKERMIGADASHAWAAVRLADGSWLGFDPTNDQLADERYTVVAWGRDYDDVPPLRGVIYTDAESNEMDVSVDVAPLPAG